MTVSAGTAYVGIEGDFSALNKQVSGHFSKLAGQASEHGKKAGAALGKGLAVGVGAAGATAGALFMNGLNDAIDAEKANSKLAAQLGSTKATSKKMGKTAGKVYAEAYGDSLGQVNDAIRGIVQNDIAKKTSKDVEGLTKTTLNLAAAFDVDVADATRGVGQLMRTGLVKNATEAFDIIFKGFQKGGDKAEDLIDTLNEYSTQWRSLGLTAKAATGLIVQGLKAGATSSDLVADALKEFSIRAVDGSKTTSAAFKSLGLDGDAMAKKIAGGGKGAAQGLDQTLDALRKIKDPIKRAQVATELFGTQAEDLKGALFALDPSKAVSALGKVEGAAKKAGDTINDNTAARFEELKRKVFAGFQGAAAKYVLPEFDAILKIVNDPKLTNNEKLGKIGDQIAKGLEKAKPAIEAAIKGLTPVVTDAIKVVAPAAASAFVGAFTEAPVWARLLVGAWFFKKLGGAKAFATIGAAAAAAMAGGVTAGTTAGAAGAASKVAKVAKIGKVATIGSSAAVGSVGGPWGIAIAAAIGAGIAFSPEIADGVGKALDFFTTSDAEKKGREIAKDIAKGASEDAAIQAALKKKIGDAQAQIRQVQEGLRETKIDPNTGVATMVIRPPTAEEKQKIQAAYNTMGEATAKAYVSGFDPSKFWDEASLFVKFRDEIGKLPPQARQSAVDTMTDYANGLEESGHLARGGTQKLVQDIKREIGVLPSAMKTESGKAMDNIVSQLSRRDAITAFKTTVDGILNVFPTQVRAFDPARSVVQNFQAMQTDLRNIIKTGTPAAAAAAREQLKTLQAEYKKWGKTTVTSFDDELKQLGIGGSKSFAGTRDTLLKDAEAVASGVKGSGGKLKKDLNEALKQAGEGGNKKAAATRTNIVNRFLEGAQGVGAAGGTMGDAIGTSVAHASDTTYKGLGNVEANLNAARTTLGLDPISFGLEKRGKEKLGPPAPKPAANPWQALPTVPFGAQTGRYVPGHGMGDKIPAMLESGEYVLNKNVVKAVGKTRLDALNFEGFPRFQAGGGVNWGGHPALTGPIARAVGLILGKFPGLGVSSTSDHKRLTSSGNVSNHVMGLAADIAGSPDIMLDASSYIGKTMGPSLLEGIHNPNLSWKNGAQVPPSFWGGAWGEHIDHIHIALKALAALLAEVAGQTVKGPKGALTGFIQQSIDLVTGLANSSLEGQGGGDTTSYGAGALTKAQLKTLWTQAGGDPAQANLMAAIALAESGGIPTRNNADRPGDGGRTIAAGLWQILGLPFEGDVYDPLTNAKMAVSKYNSQGLGAWSVYTSGAYRQYLQKGGAPRPPNVSETMTGTAGPGYNKPFTKLKFSSTTTKELLADMKASDKVTINQGNASALARSLADIDYDTTNYKAWSDAVGADAEWAETAADLTNTDKINQELQLELERRQAALTFEQRAALADQTKTMLPSQMSAYISEAIFPAAAQQAIVDQFQGRAGPGNLTQLDWLNKQLSDMMVLRNLILVDTPGVDAKVLDIAEQIKQAKDLKKRIEDEIKRLTDEISAFEDKQGDVRDERTRISGAIKDETKELEDDQRDLVKEGKKKKPNKTTIKNLTDSIARHTDHLDNYNRRYDILSGGSQGQIAAVHDLGNNQPYKHKKWHSLRDYQVLLAQDNTDKRANEREQVRLDETVIPNLEDRETKLKDAQSSLSDSLTTLQGKFAPRDLMAALPELGVLHGDIHSVHVRRNELTDHPTRVTAEIPSDSAADTRQKELDDLTIRRQLEEIQRLGINATIGNAFTNLPFEFGGSFETGGTVPGPIGAPRMIVAHGGETVVPNDASYMPGVTLNFANGMEWLRQFVSVQVDNQTRTQSRRSERGLPGQGSRR